MSRTLIALKDYLIPIFKVTLFRIKYCMAAEYFPEILFKILGCCI